MFKSIVTIFRGRSHEAAEAVVDANAMTILDQQIRDCVAAIEATKRTLALAIAQERQEAERLKKVSCQIEDLEARARQALEAGNEDLALEAAETIASLETEHKDASKALTRHNGETGRLHTTVKQAKQRLIELERGRCTAVKTEAVLKLRDVQTGTAASFQTTMRDAEATLDRLKQRQGDLDAAADALDELESETSPKSLKDKFADAGFGEPTRTQAQDVLARLKASKAKAASN
jgi:phage shock protein A